MYSHVCKCKNIRMLQLLAVYVTYNDINNLFYLCVPNKHSRLRVIVSLGGTAMLLQSGRKGSRVGKGLSMWWTGCLYFCPCMSLLSSPFKNTFLSFKTPKHKSALNTHFPFIITTSQSPCPSAHNIKAVSTRCLCLYILSALQHHATHIPINSF